MLPAVKSDNRQLTEHGVAEHSQSAPGLHSVRPEVRLKYVDGLRALAALAIVILHTFQIYGIGMSEDVRARGDLLASYGGKLILDLYEYLFQYGHYAVQIFIVLSGFSLMLPVARSLEGRLRRGAFGFWMQRARRILPPYYMSLCLAALLAVLIPAMNRPQHLYWDGALPIFERGVVLSHLFLVHNSGGSWYFKINPPLWTIAVEWQIYFLFPILVFLWRKLGSAVTLALGLIFGIVQVFLRTWHYPLSDFWLVGLFTMGMIAAAIGFSRHPAERRWLARMPWKGLALLFFVSFVVLNMLAAWGVPLGDLRWLIESLCGAVVACLLVVGIELESSSPSSWLLRILEAPALVNMGHFSYSLYLIHVPILAVVALICHWLYLPILVDYGIEFLVGVPLAILSAYGFHLLFERPFMSGNTRWMSTVWRGFSSRLPWLGRAQEL